MCISSQLRFPEGQELVLPPLTSSFLKCSLLSKEENYKEENICTNINVPFGASDVRKVNITSARCLSEGDDVKTVIEVTLNITDLCFNYLPGDAIGILPKNSEDEVNIVFKRLKLELNDCQDLCKIEIDENSKRKRAAIPSHLPSLASVKYLLEYCLDLRAVLKKTFIRTLVEHTKDPKERRRLGELCCREGVTEYNKYIIKNSASILDILTSFPSCSPSLSVLLEHLPRLQPRLYSISSSPLCDPDHIRIVFNVVNDQRGRRGVCSGWLYDITRCFHDLNLKLKHLDLKSCKKDIPQIPIYLRKSTKFRIPEDPSTPLIMIGPGIGLAPFFGFLEHRRIQNRYFKGVKPINLLFFGCRHKNKDDFYRKEFTIFQNESLCRYFVCYSRDGQKSKYVQDLIRDEKWNFVQSMLEGKTQTFICGDALNMDKDVMKEISNCIQTVKGVEESVAINILQTLEMEGKLVREVWR